MINDLSLILLILVLWIESLRAFIVGLCTFTLFLWNLSSFRKVIFVLFHKVLEANLYACCLILDIQVDWVFFVSFYFHDIMLGPSSKTMFYSLWNLPFSFNCIGPIHRESTINVPPCSSLNPFEHWSCLLAKLEELDEESLTDSKEINS